MDEATKFFAVGTNMDEERFRRSIPAARRLTIASAAGFTITWNKRSAEGAKLTPQRTDDGADVLWGVVYELDAEGTQEIDRAQRSAGYRAQRVTVVDPNGTKHHVSVYLARPEMVDGSLVPCRSYRDPIVAAARASGLPTPYVERLAATPVCDP